VTATLSIDPRIEARRREVQRENDRTRMRRFAIGAAVAAVLVAAAAATRSPLLDVDEVELVGAQHTSLEEVLVASGISVGDPMLELDLDGARSRIAALPWVESVRTDRDWPGRVSFVITERDPAAQVALGDGWAVVDEDGRVLEVRPEAAAALTAIEGAAGSEEPGGWLASDALELVALAGSLEPVVADRVTAVGRTETGGLYLDLNNNATVRVGTIDDLSPKLLSVRTVLEQVALDCLAVLDVRVPTVPVITRSC